MDRSTPVGKAARIAVAGATAAKVGAKKLGLLSKRPFLSSESFQQQHAKNDAEIADVLFRGLSTLRGGAVKLAQMLSLELGLLPEVYRKELYKSHYRVPPLNRAVVRQLITSEFGRSPEEVFARFEATAFAAASLGQVHHAHARTGERLAVKLQYPGIGTALTNDLQLFKQFVLPFVRSEYLAGAIHEINQRLAEEIDYGRERRMTQWFHDHGQIPGVLVPRTFEAYSSTHVLATEFLEGMHLDQWLHTRPSQTQRDQVAQLIYDFFTRSLAELHTMHSDPNPGNYLFRDDGTIAVIDFGSAKTFEPNFCKQTLALWRAHVHDDHQAMIEHYYAMGMGNGDKKLTEETYRTHLTGLTEWISLPYREETFDFGRHTDYCTRGAELLGETIQLQAMDGFTTENILLDRNIYGLFRMFTELEARVHMKNQWIY